MRRQGITALRPNCDKCRRPVIWAISAHGRRLPIDQKPTPLGTVRLIVEAADTPPRALVVGSSMDLFDPTDDGLRYTKHPDHCDGAPEPHGRAHRHIRQ